MVSVNSVNLNAIAHDAMLEKGFIPDYSPEILHDLDLMTEPHFPLPNVEARDLRHLLWFSLDNDNSKDLDQLTYAESLPQNKYKIYIAIANVDLLVKKNTPIDLRAAKNTTSVYTPTKTFPMLPEKLSTNLTSLNPGQDRLAIIFEGIISSDGSLEKGEIYQAYVHNFAKLAYNSVADWLDGKIAAPQAIAAVNGMAAQVQLQDSITKLLEALRHKYGALSVETIEPLPIISDEGVPIDIEAVAKNRATSLIENFMIIANMISAQYADKLNLLSLRRVVIVPKRWDKIVAVAAEHGTTLPNTPDAPSLEQFIMKQKKENPLTFPDLSLIIIKLLGRGEYRVAIPGKPNPGHFGLALRDYSHSTAPNRRYPDLITQRLLLAALTNKPQPYTQSELETLAEQCTTKEDDADRIERRLKKCASAIVLSSSIGKNFDAIVTGAGDKGTWVRIITPPIEGKLVKGTEGVDVGDQIKVKLIHTDPKAGFIDFVLSN